MDPRILLKNGNNDPETLRSALRVNPSETIDILINSENIWLLNEVPRKVLLPFIDKVPWKFRLSLKQCEKEILKLYEIEFHDSLARKDIDQEIERSFIESIPYNEEFLNKIGGTLKELEMLLI